jgi:hypothetical protein
VICASELTTKPRSSWHSILWSPSS